MMSMRAARSCRVITSRFSAISQFIHQPSCIRYYVHRTSARLQTTRALLQKPDSFSRWSSEAFARHSFAGYPARFYTAKPSSFESPSTQEASGRDIVLSPPALVVTREFEWANILVGFEQANKYTIRAAPGGNVVGYLAEEDSLGRSITRNVLRTHRPFKATVFDIHRNPLFIIRRPFYFVSTSIFVETPEGEVLGEVHMNWHMWRRRYSLYVNKAQFASVNSGFLAVDFDMRDVDDKKIASVNKDFTGFAREIFTDARQYVLRLDPAYGIHHDGELIRDASTVDLQHEEYGEMKVGLRERAVILATAISIDFDYFSVHSRGGHLHPGFMPMPIPGGGGGAAGSAAGGAAANAGTIAGADILSDSIGATEDGGGVDQDPYASPVYESDHSSSVDPDTSPNDDHHEWATFEEPDHGFEDAPTEGDEWAESDDPWGSDHVSEDGDEGGGLFGLVKGVFFDDD